MKYMYSTREMLSEKEKTDLRDTTLVFQNTFILFKKEWVS